MQARFVGSPDLIEALARALDALGVESRTYPARTGSDVRLYATIDDRRAAKLIVAASTPRAGGLLSKPVEKLAVPHPLATVPRRLAEGGGGRRKPDRVWHAVTASGASLCGMHSDWQIQWEARGGDAVTCKLCLRGAEIGARR